MDFSYTEEQEMLRDGVGKFLEKSYDFDARQAVVRSEDPWSNDAWSQFAEFGLLALPFAEEQGGLGGSITDCVAVSELFGKHLCLEPFIGSIMLAAQALASSDSSMARDWLEKLMSGDAIGAFAYEEGRGTASPDMVAMNATKDGTGYLLTGEKRHVLAGAEADVVVVVARDSESDALALFLVKAGAGGMDARGYQTVDGCSAANIRFDNVSIEADAVVALDCQELVEQLLTNAMIVRAAEAVGAMGALLAMTGEYAATRKQFGVPIGTFQAVAHRLADMKIAYNKALATMTYTAALAESGGANARDIAIMKGQVGKLGRAVGEAAIQTHGGVGMTDELSVSHFHKRLLAIDAQFGSAAYHLRTVGVR